MTDLADKFEAEFPEFFRDVQCGFYLPDRWGSLVWTMCENIRREMQHAKVPLKALHVAQVKEKFWGLRFYYDLDLDCTYHPAPRTRWQRLKARWPWRRFKPQEDKNAALRAHIRGLVDMAESLSVSGLYELPKHREMMTRHQA